MLTKPPVPYNNFTLRDRGVNVPHRGLLRDCTTGCGTDGALHSTNFDLIKLVARFLPRPARHGGEEREQHYDRGEFEHYYAL